MSWQTDRRTTRWVTTAPLLPFWGPELWKTCVSTPSPTSAIVNLIFFICFRDTLYHAHSRIGRGNVVLKHSVLHFLSNYGDITGGVTKLNAALCLHTKAKKLKMNFIFSNGNRTYNISRLQSHFVRSPRHSIYLYLGPVSPVTTKVSVRRKVKLALRVIKLIIWT